MPLNDVLQWSGGAEGTTTITVKDCDGVESQLTVHGGMIPWGYKCNGNAEHYLVVRQSGKLYVVGGSCPVT